MGIAIPLIAAAAPAAIAGVESLFGGNKKATTRTSDISQLQQQAAQGDPGALAELEEWATGQTEPGSPVARTDEPGASRTQASQALTSLGVNVPTSGNAVPGVSGIGTPSASTIGGAGTSPAPSTSGSVLPSVAGGALGAAAGATGVLGGNGSLGNALTLGMAGAGIGQSAQDYANQQSLYNTALAQEQNQYNDTAGLRTQGTNALENAVASAPNLSSAYATPSNPFSTPGAAAPQGAGPGAVSPAVTAQLPPAVPQPVPAVK